MDSANTESTNKEATIADIGTFKLQRFTNEAPQKAQYLPSVHGKATDAIAQMAGKPLEIDPIALTGSVVSMDVKVVFSKLEKLSKRIGINPHKLLSMAMVVFTENNHTGIGKNKGLRETKALFSLQEYAHRRGYKIAEEIKETPEAQAKEKRRARKQLEKAKTEVQYCINALLGATITWEETVKGKKESFGGANILSEAWCKNGMICLDFTPRFASYLVGLPLTQYPTALLEIDGKKDNAYNMGFKIAEHYSMDNNQIRGTAHCLRVKTLLAVTNLPDPNSPAVKKVGWKARIKEPFETALDALTDTLLESGDGWYYSHSKGERLTDKEAEEFSSYEEWANTLVFFALKDAPDHTPRLEARAQEKKEQQARSRKKTGKKKKD